MNLEQLLAQEEGKTLEFKEGTAGLRNVLKAVVAFANTAGGTLVIGVRDGDKEVVGVSDPLREEERLASAIADSVEPLLIPEIELWTYRERQLLVVRVSRAAGPFRLTGPKGQSAVYVRLGSTNRKADEATVQELARLARNETFDELPCLDATQTDLDWDYIRGRFRDLNRQLTTQRARAFGLVVSHQTRELPSNGAILVCGKSRGLLFPDAVLRCVAFSTKDRQNVRDHQDFDLHLPSIVDEAISFLERHTEKRTEITLPRRIDRGEYPADAVREVLVNAIVHADYSIRGASPQLAIFPDRIEVTNPGGLPYGLNLRDAVSGASKLRNRVIGRIFRELGLIDQWGSGLQRVIGACRDSGLRAPLFEELGVYFRATLYNETVQASRFEPWEQLLIKYLSVHDTISPKDAAVVWGVTPRTARTRLAKLQTKKVVTRIATSPKDPKAIYVLKSTAYRAD